MSYQILFERTNPDKSNLANLVTKYVASKRRMKFQMRDPLRDAITYPAINYIEEIG